MILIFLDMPKCSLGMLVLSYLCPDPHCAPGCYRGQRCRVEGLGSGLVDAPSPGGTRTHHKTQRNTPPKSLKTRLAQRL